jgi:hypothetical protein
MLRTRLLLHHIPRLTAAGGMPIKNDAVVSFATTPLNQAAHTEHHIVRHGAVTPPKSLPPDAKSRQSRARAERAHALRAMSMRPPSASKKSIEPSPTTFEKTLLPHHPITATDTEKLKKLLGPDVFEKIRKSRHKEGLCHSDTAITFIEAAKRTIDPTTMTLMDFPDSLRAQGSGFFHYLSMLFGGLLNACVPLQQNYSGNTVLYSKQALIEHGVPEDCLAIIVSGSRGMIDPHSKHARSARYFFNAGEAGGASHAFAVLSVDKEAGQLLCCDLDPHRKNDDGSDRDVFFKIDIDTFEKRTLPYWIAGVMAVPKKARTAPTR